MYELSARAAKGAVATLCSRSEGNENLMNGPQPGGVRKRQVSHSQRRD